MYKHKIHVYTYIIYIYIYTQISIYVIYYNIQDIDGYCQFLASLQDRSSSRVGLWILGLRVTRATVQPPSHQLPPSGHGVLEMPKES